MSKSFSGLIDDNPEKVLDLYLGDSKCAGHYAYLLSHTDYSKSLKDFDNILSVLYFQISEWLEPVKTSLKDDSYDDASNMCANCIDDILPKVKELNLFNYDQDLVNIDYIIMAYTQSILANLCQSYGRYKLGMNMYSEWLTLDTFIRVNHGWSYDEIVSNRYKEIGSMGGAQKGINYSPSLEKAYSYHDKYLSEKNEKGKYMYSGNKAAEEIINYYDDKHESLGYEISSLANKINKHRRK